MQKVKHCLLKEEDFTMRNLGQNPMFPEEQLIKVFAADRIGFAKTEEEAIHLIDELQNW